MEANAGKAGQARLTAVAALAAMAAVASGAALHEGVSRLDVALDAAVPEPAFVAAAQMLAAGCGCWLAIGTLCALLAEARWGGRAAARLGARVLPAGWRAAVLTAVGTGLLTSPAMAAGPTGGALPGDHDPGHLATSAVAVLDGLALPDRAAGAWRRPSRSVTVRPGDSLWALSSAALPAGADAAAIARRCWRWYDANAEVIGDDPDLLLPGTRLLAPAAASRRPTG